MTKNFKLSLALVLLGCANIFPTSQAAELQAALAATRVELLLGDTLADLVCPRRARQPAAAAPDPDPPEMPSEQDIGALSQSVVAEEVQPPTSALNIPRHTDKMRVAVWGDSHMAAAFFTDELVRIAGLDSDQARPAVLPANFGRAGVRLSIRRACIDGNWRHESAHQSSSVGAQSAPGLVSLVSSTPGAELTLDLRAPRSSITPTSVRLLYEGQPGLARLALSADGGTEQQVALSPHIGPAALDVVSSSPASQLRVRLLEGTLRLQGVELGLPVRARLQLDVFGYPGATVEGWSRINPERLRAWLAHDAYDMVILGYGTNEGNQSPFDPAAYRRSLTSAVNNLRGSFPMATCVLIGPGDRGVLVRRSQKSRTAHTKQSKRAGKSATSAPQQSDALLRFTRIHAEIAAIQAEVAQGAGCWFWSPWHSMGGVGSSYRWAKSGLMANDLTHFTVKGYQKLAESFAAAAGWNRVSITQER